MIEQIAENVEVTEIQVEEGTRQLQMALNYKKTIYPLLGGFIGACMLGPVGLVAGLKAGSAAGLCGGICGYAGGKFLKKTGDSPTEALSPVEENPLGSLETANPEDVVKWTLFINFWHAHNLLQNNHKKQEVNVDNLKIKNEMKKL